MNSSHDGARERRFSSKSRDELLDETTSLLLSRTRSQETIGVENVAVQIPPEVKARDQDEEDPATKWPYSVRYSVYVCAFITSLSFGVTQVPYVLSFLCFGLDADWAVSGSRPDADMLFHSLLYVFRLMTCDAYYKAHPSQVLFAESSPVATFLFSLLSPPSIPYLASTLNPDNDRCSIREIESSTALSISLLGASTTAFGLLNLFWTGSLIKRLGVRLTLIIQVFFPALRLLVQNIGVELGGSVGIIVVQCSQIVSVIGGPSGYLLVLNTFITEVVEYEGRTAALGMLTGAMMFGSALGFLLGGIVGDVFGIKAPFRLTFILFLSCCIYVFLVLPYIAPAEPSVKKVGQGSEARRRKKGLKRYLGPLAVFAPSKWIGLDGKVRTEYGSFLLAWGVFLGILATGYIPTFLQMYSTDMFAFGTKENGWLIFMYSSLRGLFLTAAFPRLIGAGRKWISRREEAKRTSAVESESERLLGGGSTADEGSRLLPDNNDDDVDKTLKKEQTFIFDLHYTKFSLIADGLLTLLCTFVRKGWQMYLVAAVLPFAAGTGSAAKGTILLMVGSSASSSERTDAMAGVSLVENMARLSTTFIFGMIFAAFASIGKTQFVFICNAAVALVGFCVLLFARFPIEGSRRLEDDEVPTETEEE
ncbi:hypothetical protein H2198_007630 [Neophaeococcomyces mojaviensis]|uniref:Uncharacterized protein n=1 Tax=Neophaeococcomyces mojaviensis TaxID=3383035 RepID=A0ACC2ZZF6_9EURO|nr:hypothetical protein H2198_007630 [Knufia sp. JES_112]